MEFVVCKVESRKYHKSWKIGLTSIKSGQFDAKPRRTSTF